MTWKTPLGEPIGAPVSLTWTVPKRPGRDFAEGRWTRLEPIDADRHGASLFAALMLDAEGSDWTYRMQEPPASHTTLTTWLKTLETRHDMVYVAYVNRETGQALGKGAFMTIAPEAGSIEIGSIIFSRAMQGNRLGAEAIYLMLQWAFEAGYRRVEWTCDPLNAASMKAAERYGFSYEALFRQAYVTKGRNRDKAIFACLETDWPKVKAAFDTWLEPGNFEPDGQQITRLSDLTAPVLTARARAFTSRRLNAHGQPIGAEVQDWTPPPPPPRDPLEGRFCRLEPLGDHHADDLFDALSEDHEGQVFTYMPNGPFDTVEDYRAWVGQAVQPDDPLQFAILVEGRAVGTASFLRINPEAGSIEVGFITFSPRLQRTIAATEAMFLMMRWAFEAGYRRYEWKCNALNQPSRRAAQRLGLSYEGTFRLAQIVKSRNRDTAWYAAIDSEWPSLRAAFETWLAVDNFDAQGQQRQSLTTLTRPILKATG